MKKAVVIVLLLLVVGLAAVPVFAQTEAAGKPPVSVATGIVIAAGFSLAALYLARASGWSPASRQGAWSALFGFALTALTAAAFLRWFS